MKIGVITFWDSKDNYGQLLQCYALQQYLRKLGHEVCLIRYLPLEQSLSVPAFLKKITKLFSFPHLISYINYRRNLKRQRIFNQRYPRHFDAFRLKYIVSTEKVYKGHRTLWLEDWSSFDVLICGSDQIWRHSTEDDLRAYYLDFGSIDLKRIAYAVSFGCCELSLEYQVLFPKLLNRLDVIGLREQSGVNLCESVGRKDVQLVCDPTLLLTGNDYESLIVEDIRSSEKILLCYLLDWKTLFPYTELENYARKNNLDVKFIPAHGSESKYHLPIVEDLSIEAWIKSIVSSKYVVTNSFHGVVFCILFHCPFISLPLQGTSSGMNDRIVTLLDKLDLKEQIYSSSKTLEEILSRPIDWNVVERKLEIYRKESSIFLLAALREKKKNEYTIKNICFQTNGGVNHEFGGLDRVTELLADYFEQQGMNVYYLSFTHRPATNNKRQYYLPDSKYLKSKKNIYYYNEFLREKEIDVLINQEGNVDITLPCQIVDRKILYITALHFTPNYIPDTYFNHRISKLDIPFICKKVLEFVVCRIGVDKYFLNYLRWKLKRNYQYQVKCCDQFVLLSDRFKQDIAQFFPKKLPYNICAINNPSTFSTEKIDVDFSQKKKVVLYVGRIEIGQKRLDRLLRIWNEVSLIHADWTLKLVGNGPDLNVLKQQVVDRHIQQVLFEGMQDPQPYYKEASIFCLTSSSEGWGMVLVEAQSYGCVPIAFNSFSSLKDIINDGDNGFVIDNSKEEMYISKLDWLMENNLDRNRMAKSCIETSKQFSIDKIGEKWFTLFESFDCIE